MITAPAAPAPSAEARFNTGYIWTVCLVAALGGLLFGYDWVVIGGAKPFFERFFGLTDAAQKGWANSCALIGCLLGALIAGSLSDRYGRKRLLLFAAFLFALTSIGNALAGTFTVFVAWRMLGGVAIGLASNLSPMYIAEVAPARARGQLVSINQLTIVLGILAAQFVNYFIAEPLPAQASEEAIRNSWNGQSGWRWMFAATAVPSLLFFLGMLFVPESPRWLAKNGRLDRARDVLARIGGPEYAAAGIARSHRSSSKTSSRSGAVSEPAGRSGRACSTRPDSTRQPSGPRSANKFLMIPSYARSRTRWPGWSALPQLRTAKPDSPRGGLLVTLIALVLAGGGLGARPAFAAAQVRPQWTWRNPVPTGNDLLGVAVGNGTMVAVGSGGTLLSSTDGHEWTQQWDGRSTPLTDVLFVNGQFVAVGGDGVILSSTDGTNWLSRAVAPTFNLRQVAYGLGRYVVAAESQGRCAFLSSTQLESWTTWWLPERQPLTRVTFGDGRFVGIGSATSGADSTGVFVSTNGVSWMDRSTSAVLGGTGVAAAQGAVIVGDRFGNLWRSFNVSDWELAGGSAAGSFRNLMVVNGQFVATVDSSPPGLLSSPDGFNWSAWESGGIMPLNAVAGDGKRYLGVGDFGQIVGSPDGQTWTNRTGYLAPEFARARWFEAVTFGNGRFVAVGCAAAAVSTDGEHWIATGLAPNTWLVGVVFDGHRFVAVGKQGAVAWSTDGMTWEGGDPVSSDDFASVAFGGGVYMAAVARRKVAGSVAGSALMASTNLTAWREVYVRDGVGAARIAFGDNRFVATLNGSDVVCVTANGTHWETRTLTEGTLADVIYADERFHAVNGSSPDGLAWSFAAGPPVLDDPTWEYVELGGLAGGDGRFAALGSHEPRSSRVLVSTNGTTWLPTVPAPIRLLSTAYGNGTFIAVGGQLGILQSPATGPTPAIQLAAARLGLSQLQIRVSSAMGMTLAVERSLDLKSWSVWRTIVNTTGQSLLTDALVPPPGRSFYRARAL